MTPQEIAEAVLDKIEKNQDLLYMGSWTNYPGWVRGGEEITCGTTLCAGGWIVHVLGHNFQGNGLTDVEFKLGDETYYRSVESIAQEAMELTDDEARYLFYVADEKEAIRIFQEIADGNGFPFALPVRRVEDVPV